MLNVISLNCVNYVIYSHNYVTVIKIERLNFVTVMILLIILTYKKNEISEYYFQQNT